MIYIFNGVVICSLLYCGEPNDEQNNSEEKTVNISTVGKISTKETNNNFVSSEDESNSRNINTSDKNEKHKTNLYSNFDVNELNKILNSTTWDFKIDINDLKKSTIKQTIILALKWGRVIIGYPNGKIVDSTKDWYITHENSGVWNYKEFNYTEMGRKISHKNLKSNKNSGTGVLPYAIKGLYEEVRNKEMRFDAIIVSNGMSNILGVNQKTIDLLNNLKNNKDSSFGDKIKEFYILNSKDVPAKHLELVKKGYKVGTLIHITC